MSDSPPPAPTLATTPAVRSRWIERALSVGVQAHVWVALAATSLSAFAAMQLGLAFDVIDAQIVAVSTLVIYNLDSWVDGRRRLPRVALVATAACGLGLGLFCSPLELSGVVLIGLAACTLYAIEIRGFVLKRLFPLKALFVASAVTVGVVAVPWIRHGGEVVTTTALATGLFLLGLVGTNVVIFDLRDHHEDRERRVPTFSVRWGRRRTVAVLVVAQWAWVPILAVLGFDLLPAVAVSLSYVLIVTRVRGVRDYRLDLLVDGVPVIVPWLASGVMWS